MAGEGSAVYINFQDAIGPPTDGPPADVPQRWRWASIAASLAAIIVVGLSLSGDGLSLSALSATVLLSRDPPVVHDVAQVVIIRHGEKDQGTGLSDVGASRAQYIARCMSSRHSTTALPRGPPTYVMASHGHPGNSHRPRDTVAPVARALGLPLDDSIYFKEAATFASRVLQKLRPKMTMLVAWHHEEIPKLISHLLGEEDMRLASLHWPDSWRASRGGGRVGA